MKVILFLISVLFLNVSNQFHKDAPLQVDNNGNIIGLLGKSCEFSFGTVYFTIFAAYHTNHAPSVMCNLNK